LEQNPKRKADEMEQSSSSSSSSNSSKKPNWRPRGEGKHAIFRKIFETTHKNKEQILTKKKAQLNASYDTLISLILRAINRHSQEKTDIGRALRAPNGDRPSLATRLSYSTAYLKEDFYSDTPITYRLPNITENIELTADLLAPFLSLISNVDYGKGSNFTFIQGLDLPNQYHPSQDMIARLERALEKNFQPGGTIIPLSPSTKARKIARAASAAGTTSASNNPTAYSFPAFPSTEPALGSSVAPGLSLGDPRSSSSSSSSHFGQPSLSDPWWASSSSSSSSHFGQPSLSDPRWASSSSA